MGAISPLNQSSHSFELVQDLTGFDKSEEYSIFSDYLSPLSFRQEFEYTSHPSYQEDLAESAPINDSKDMQLFAKVEEPPKDEKPKLFAEKKDVKSSDTSTKRSTSSREEVRPAAVKNNAQPHGARKAAQTPSASIMTVGAKEDGLSILKENVKHILSGLKNSPDPVSRLASKNVPVTKTQAQAENLPSFKVYTETQGRAAETQLQQTTVAHLASRGKKGAVGGKESFIPLPEQALHSQKQSAIVKKGPSTQARPMNPTQGEQLSQSPAQARRIQSRKDSQSGKTQSRTPQANTQQTSNNNAYTTGTTAQDLLTATQLNPESVVEQKAAKQNVQDAATNDGDFKNLLSKGQQKTSATSKEGPKAKAASRTSRAMNWLRTLSDRTALLDKTNPQWKVLEMQLEKGNGKMTVKVMKESDHVSVAVNFSDPEVKAMAEAQYKNILENLQEQYQQEVKFTFNDQEQTPFESFNSHRAPSYQTTPNLTASNLSVQEPKVEPEHPYSNQQGWIG